MTLSTATDAVRDFLPWLRRGLAGSIGTKDTLDATTPGRVQVPVTLTVNSGTPTNIPVRFFGPGDVIGIDPREVVRTEPRAGVAEFEPNYFPAIEFDDPGLPWLFTPAAADAQGRLRPWLCLVTVRQDASTIEPVVQGRPLPAVVCPLTELPDLHSSWAWAHAQITRNPDPAAGQTVRNVLELYPDYTVSRLISPRRLDAGVAYRACVVPTFAGGRKAGLGLPLAAHDEAALEPAWPLSDADSGESPGGGAAPSVRLPVYYMWEFSTGPAGDFETLVRRLHRPSAPLGLRPPRIDVSHPGWTIPVLTWDTDPVILDMQGALRPPGPPPADTWQGDVRYTFEQQVTTLLDAIQQSAVPLIGPPLYGQQQARQFTVPGPQDEPHWLRELNLDPRLRAAAGLGVLAVRGEQEALVASAWQQLAEQNAADQQLQRRQQVASEVADALNAKHLAPLAPAQFARVAAPALRALASVPTASAATARAMAAQPAPVQPPVHPALNRAPMLDPAHRRMSRLFAPRFRSSALPTAEPAVTRATSEHPVADSLARWLARPSADGLSTAHQIPSHGILDQARGGALREMAAPASEGPQEEPPPFAPTFVAPAYELLRDYFPDLLLPGMSAVPPNTVALLETNPAFIEAFMVGLNHEIIRELVWRGFPIALRTTPFRQFWASPGLNTPDLPAIEAWAGSSHLGDHFGVDAAAGLLVLLIRGDLLHRYPRTAISAVEARWSADGKKRELGTVERQPLFRGAWGLDVTLLGFGLTEAEARGSTTPTQHPGWFFVIQEQPTEPRFGLDAPLTVSGPPATWDDLAWGHLAPTPDQVRAITYVSLDGPLRGLTLGGTQWGANAAHMAAITLQRAFRVAIHASEWLPDPT
jgi:hypothetical protein